MVAVLSKSKNKSCRIFISNFIMRTVMLRFVANNKDTFQIVGCLCGFINKNNVSSRYKEMLKMDLDMYIRGRNISTGDPNKQVNLFRFQHVVFTKVHCDNCLFARGDIQSRQHIHKHFILWVGVDYAPLEGAIKLRFIFQSTGCGGRGYRSNRDR